MSFFYNTDAFIDNEYGALDNETLLAEIKRRADEQAEAAKVAATKAAAAADAASAAADAANSGLTTSTINPATVTETDAQRFSRIGAQLARGENVTDGDYDFYQAYGSQNPPKTSNANTPDANTPSTLVTAVGPPYYTGQCASRTKNQRYSDGSVISTPEPDTTSPGCKSDPPPPPPPPPSGDSDSKSSGSSTYVPPTPSAVPPVPLSTSLIPIAPVKPPIKTAPIDTVLTFEEEIAEASYDLLWENIGGQELINITRNDIVNGQTVLYQPIKNITSIQQQYNPNNIVSLQDTSDSYFANFSIKLETSLIEEGEGSGPDGAYIFIDSDGDLVVELLNVDPDQQMEVEISQSGTIYEASI